jgi:hypothetical protein
MDPWAVRASISLWFVSFAVICGCRRLVAFLCVPVRARVTRRGPR